jgi:predicted transcriptional regulator
LIESDPRRAEAELAEAGRVTREALGQVREAVHGYRRLAFADALDAARATLAATAAEIAAHLYLAEGTVRNYLSAAIRKLGARNRADALRIAQEKGWL